LSVHQLLDRLAASHSFTEVFMINRAFANILAAAVVACTAGAVAALTPSLAQGLPNGEGKELVRRICARCHDLSPITSTGLSRREWDMVLDSMANMGANIAASERPIILDYLATSFPPKTK
jgi:hypothetical protein